MLTRFDSCTLTSALVWPLASALNLLNRHLRSPSASQGIGSSCTFDAGTSNQKEDGQCCTALRSCQNIANSQTIRTIGGCPPRSHSPGEWNRCKQRPTETQVSNITHCGIGHSQAPNIARDTFLAVTHVPHLFAA